MKDLKTELQKNNRTKVIAFKLTEKEHDKIKKFCDENDTTISIFARYAIDKIMDTNK